MQGPTTVDLAERRRIKPAINGYGPKILSECLNETDKIIQINGLRI